MLPSFDTAYWQVMAGAAQREGIKVFAVACDRYLRMQQDHHDKLRAFAAENFKGHDLAIINRAIDGTIKPTISLNISEAFRDKVLIDGDKRAFGNSFKPAKLTVQQLVDHILSGKAFSLGSFEGDTRRKDTFKFGQLVGKDLDNGVSVADALKHPFIRAYAFLVYATPSHTPELPKTRVLYMLSEPVYGVEAFESILIGLLQEFSEIEPDPKCKDAARFFYGSTQPGAHVNLNARLPIDLARSLPTPRPKIADLIKSKSSQPVKPSALVNDLFTLRVDSEVGRLCIPLNLKSELRVSAIAQHINVRRYKGRGWLKTRVLRRYLKALGIEYTDRHFRRLLAEGNGIFWYVGETRLRLIGKRKIGAELTRRAMALNPAIVETNPPGLKRDVLLPIGKSLEEWEALIYAGWLAAKKNPDISRQTLATLFGRTPRTIRHWEAAHLEGIVSKTPNRAQSAELDAFEGKNHYDYQVVVTLPVAGCHIEKRTGRQLPNTYHSTVKSHSKRGQARKVLMLSRKSLGLQPFDESDEGLKRNLRENWYSHKALCRTIEKTGQGGRLFIGKDRGGWKVLEPTADGHVVTHANEKRYTKHGRYTTSEGAFYA
jgi:hypothetical protein